MPRIHGAATSPPTERPGPFSDHYSRNAIQINWNRTECHRYILGGRKLLLRAAHFWEICAFESTAPEEPEYILISGAKQLQTFNFGT
jgi:ectoine hydroxylase-related dioxygenase (phytanoyl-CoA dioxygenase family)